MLQLCVITFLLLVVFLGVMFWLSAMIWEHDFFVDHSVFCYARKCSDERSVNEERERERERERPRFVTKREKKKNGKANTLYWSDYLVGVINISTQQQLPYREDITLRERARQSRTAKGLAINYCFKSGGHS